MQKAPTRTRLRRPIGVTLVELMVVVVIIGVLSAIAIPTFSDYTHKARAAEATEFLGVIRLREESYRSEFGQYCATFETGSTAVANIASNLVPAAPGRDPVPFIPNTQWLRLGARPSGQVRFGFGVARGAPNQLPAGLGWTSANADFWYVAQAIGDLDGDSTQVTFETYSGSKNVWVGGDDEARSKGWE